jgi:hypothetical protein
MKRVVASLLVALVVMVLGATAQADPSEYGIESASAVASSIQAGAHPEFIVALRLKKNHENRLPSSTKDLFFEAPPGLLGNPNAVPKCSAAQLLGTDTKDPSNETGCPQASQVGITEIQVFDQGNLIGLFEPVYSIEPGFGEPARFGFIANFIPVLLDTELRSDGDYGVTVKVEGASALVPILAAKTTLWGTPADESHDEQRITPYEAVNEPRGVPHTPTGKRSANLVPVPFMSNPTRCGVAQGMQIIAIPNLLPTLKAEAFAPLTPNTGCGLLDFEPKMSVKPTTDQAETGSGLNVELEFPTKGLEHPNLFAEATQKRAEVTLPEGVTVNPSQAAGGLGVCSEADLDRETPTSAPDAGCPETSKIGTITAKSPLLDEAAEGGLFLAKPYENPFGTLLALYFVLKIPERGVIVKLPARVEPDPQTGQLVTTVEDIPQLPVEDFDLNFREGARSPLITPPGCGTYHSTATFTSWAEPDNPLTLRPSFEITRGVDGGACPRGPPPFRPGFSAGAINNNAASYSPYYLRLTRQDGDQDLTKFATTFPPGAVAKLAGVGRCADAAIEAAKARTGTQELASPSCPAGSEIGHVLGGAGVGSVLTYVPGKLYLAGPYKGANLSVVSIVPAVAGPFDVGTVVTRVALSLDPDTGRGVVDGSRSDPLPHILAGIPLKVRDIRVYVDRPEFTLNPTGCDVEAFKAQIWAGGLDVFSSADDSPFSLTSRFQAANCALLGFKPRLSLKLSGGTRRGAYPALRAVVRPRKGDANIGAAQVALPRSAFIEQAHFRTICTRVQFAANQCPAGSVYGHVRAFSPLLDEPLEGHVYLRSSSHQLPDIVFALRGIVDLNVVGRVDSIKGRLRTTFASIPDAPVTKAVITMQGARKGLFVNSTNLCAGTQRAAAELDGHNGKAHDFTPVVKNSCGGKGKKRGKGGKRLRTDHHR